MSFIRQGTHAYAVLTATLLLAANHSCFAQVGGAAHLAGMRSGDEIKAPRTRDNSRPKAMLGAILVDHSGAVVISELYIGGPAERAGLRTGDRIVALAGHPVNVRAQVADILKQYRPADQVDLLVSRREWERRVLVTLAGTQQIASLPRGSIQATATGPSPLRNRVPNGYGNLHWAEGESVWNVYDVNRRALYTAFD
ncbi:MAG TPA: PDZ domain-containing protein [Pirellulales bacterium]|nr:PDZ domain-containing protein [Pirellulales bacterium]